MNGRKARMLRRHAHKIWTEANIFFKGKNVAPLRKIYQRLKAAYKVGEFKGRFMNWQGISINGRW